MDKLTVSLRDGRVVVLLGTDEIANLADLRARAAGVPAADLANAVTVLGPDGYEVITDPAAFRAAYLAKLETEDPHEPWRPEVIRLRDFGVPDFTQIAAPSWEGDHLVFFARDTFSGLPYRMDLTLSDGAAPAYLPMGLVPLPGDPAPVTATNPVIGPQEPPNDMERVRPVAGEFDDDEDEHDEEP